jgi:ElaB/YqjD/DUF883 family membrane-anchored ribosome-binding protein
MTTEAHAQRLEDLASELEQLADDARELASEIRKHAQGRAESVREPQLRKRGTVLG